MNINKVLSSGATTAAHKDPERAGVGSTAFGAALIRAYDSTIKSRAPLVHDPVACVLFNRGTRPKGMSYAFVVMYTLWQWLPYTYPLFFIMKNFLQRDVFANVDMIGTRTKFIDDSITNAVEQKGTKQVVIMGAGLDARGARLPVFQSSGIATLYEIDFAGMLQAKRELFIEVGFGDCYTSDTHRAIHVGTDLSESPKRWKKDLVDAGFNPKAPTVWLMEGLTGYLEKDELLTCMEAISYLSAPGSELVTTWNGAIQKTKVTPWAQSIHKTLTDNPDEFLEQFKWKREELIPIGVAVRQYGIKVSNIPANDNSYWLARHVKVA